MSVQLGEPDYKIKRIPAFKIKLGDKVKLVGRGWCEVTSLDGSDFPRRLAAGRGTVSLWCGWVLVANLESFTLVEVIRGAVLR